MSVTMQWSVRALLLVVICFTRVFAQGVPQRQDAATALPASLSNAEFWSMVSQFSEPGGNFPSDNFTSNELMIGQVAADLIARGRTGGAYIGVGAEQNFTYIAATRPEIVFIVDIRRQAIMQHLMYKAIFEMSGNRADFIARLFSKPRQAEAQRDTAIKDIWARYLPVSADSSLYRTNLAAIHNHLANVRGYPLTSADSNSIALVYGTFHSHGPHISYGSRAGMSAPVTQSTTLATFLSLTLIADTTSTARSFLASDANYQFVRGLHSRNLIIPVVGDFGGPQALRKVGDYLREHRAVVSGYYTSNVEQYLFAPPTRGAVALWREFYTSVGFMPLDSFSIFIRPNGLFLSSNRFLAFTTGLPQPATPPAGFRAPTGEPATPLPQQPTLGAFTGIVTDSITGIPIQGAVISVEGAPLRASTDANGKYAIPNVPPGIYTLVMSRSTYGSIIALDRKVSAGALTSVDFEAFALPARSSGRAATAARALAGVTLCPMTDFLAAFAAGRVRSYADATACIK